MLSNNTVQLLKTITPTTLRPVARQLRALVTRRSTPRFRAWQYEAKTVLQCQIVYNKLGGYCMPLSSRYRVAAQKVLWGHVFEPETIDFIVQHADDGDIVHAGAFFGDFLPALSRGCSASARIWAFEPDPESYRCALITTLINDLQNIGLMNAGLGEASGVAELVTRDNKGSALGELSYIRPRSGRDSPNAVAVEIVAIDDVVPANRKVSVLHLDVEGYEQQALSGALATIHRNRPFLILETLPCEEWLAKSLKPYGYRIDRQIDHNTLLIPSSVA